MEWHTLDREGGCEMLCIASSGSHVLSSISWMLTLCNCIFTASLDGQENLWLGFGSGYLLLSAEADME